MNAWKPKIWRNGSVWMCSYYRNFSAGVYRGSTPAGAYAAWKWRDELRRLMRRCRRRWRARGRGNGEISQK